MRLPVGRLRLVWPSPRCCRIHRLQVVLWGNRLCARSCCNHGAFTKSSPFSHMEMTRSRTSGAYAFPPRLGWGFSSILVPFGGRTGGRWMTTLFTANIGRGFGCGGGGGGSRGRALSSAVEVDLLRRRRTTTTGGCVRMMQWRKKLRAGWSVARRGSATGAVILGTEPTLRAVALTL